MVGIAGLIGAGRTELCQSVFGKAYGTHISGQLFKDGKDKLKISVEKNGKIKKVNSTKKVKAEKTMVGSVKGYLVDRNSTSYTFSYKEGKYLVVIKSKDLSLITGIIGKD